MEAGQGTNLGCSAKEKKKGKKKEVLNKFLLSHIRSWRD
jgi:hypothetical protein